MLEEMRDYTPVWLVALLKLLKVTASSISMKENIKRRGGIYWSEAEVLTVNFIDRLKSLIYRLDKLNSASLKFIWKTHSPNLPREQQIRVLGICSANSGPSKTNNRQQKYSYWMLGVIIHPIVNFIVCLAWLAHLL